MAAKEALVTMCPMLLRSVQLPVGQLLSSSTSGHVIFRLCAFYFGRFFNEQANQFKEEIRIEQVTS